MEEDQREFTTSPLPPTTVNDEIDKNSRIALYKVSNKHIYIVISLPYFNYITA